MNKKKIKNLTSAWYKDEIKHTVYLQHNSILHTKFVGGQRVGLPAQALVGVAEVLRARYVRAELDVGSRQVAGPRRE